MKKKIWGILIIGMFIGASASFNILTENVKAVDTTSHYQNVWNVDMNGFGTTITTLPGESITISLNYEIWNRIGCPACIAQIVIGIGNTPYYCAYNGIPGIYPGVTGSNTNSITSPSIPGTYDLMFCGHRCYTCSEAFGEYINPEREKTKIGTITILEVVGCTRTVGYWETHSVYGPAAHPDPAWDCIMPDGPDTEFFDTGYSYIEILWTPPKGGNAYLILAHQYIATELNGCYNDPIPLPGNIQNIMDDASVLLDSYDNNFHPKTGMPDIPSGGDRAEAIILAYILDDFNNGYLDWPHCDDYNNKNKLNNIQFFIQRLFQRFPLFEKILNQII
jgi:hypothetical protein